MVKIVPKRIQNANRNYCNILSPKISEVNQISRNLRSQPNNEKRFILRS